MTKTFKVAAVSSNRNSFGLTGMILMARDGEAWQVGANDLNRRAKGTLIQVQVIGKRGRNFAALGFEIPERLSKAPRKVVAEVWTDGESHD